MCLAARRSLRQHDAALTLVEREQMHRGLVLCEGVRVHLAETHVSCDVRARYPW
jgi:hypothetical protein